MSDYDDMTNADFVDPDPDYGKDLDDDLGEEQFEDHAERPAPVAEQHAEGCHPSSACVECGGCDCGLVPAICTGAGCHTIAQHDQDYDESGDQDGCAYGCH